MKISEVTLLEGGFDASFGFMLNRIGDAYEDLRLPESMWDDTALRDRCFSEFLLALEEMGVTFETVEARLLQEESDA